MQVSQYYILESASHEGSEPLQNSTLQFSLPENTMISGIKRSWKILKDEQDSRTMRQTPVTAAKLSTRGGGVSTWRCCPLQRKSREGREQLSAPHWGPLPFTQVETSESCQGTTKERAEVPCTNLLLPSWLPLHLVLWMLYMLGRTPTDFDICAKSWSQIPGDLKDPLYYVLCFKIFFLVSRLF